MKIYAGIYSWDGKKTDHREPIAWFPGSYHLKIFDLRDESSSIQHLKPYICIYAETGEGMSISTNPEKFARRICIDFNLDLDKVMWVEELGESTGNFEIVVFSPKGKLGDMTLYSISKRSPMEGELKSINSQLRLLESIEQVS